MSKLAEAPASPFESVVIRGTTWLPNDDEQGDADPHNLPAATSAGNGANPGQQMVAALTAPDEEPGHGRDQVHHARRSSPNKMMTS